ncbi:MAG: hypothetical protein GY829_02485 [Gammaproteobacteria bacterium]|nr:hypothetical protein [Gammaproteobacteria bacterium]
MSIIENETAQTMPLIAFSKLSSPFALIFFFVCSLAILVPSTFAGELHPTDNINPSQSEPALGNVPQKSTFSVDEKKIEDPIERKSNSEPSWWNWLTNASNKPANFHFIDIIELLS